MQNIEKNISNILGALCEDAHRADLQNTPQRAAEALQFLTSGYREKLSDITEDAIFSSNVSEMVMLQGVELFSLCEHHLLPFFGKCHIAYIPNGKIIGLSKLARIVDFFARRLQVQERLTQEIAELIMEITGCLGVGVIMEAQHLCMMMRGIQKQNAIMKTSVMLGLFKEDPHVRAEFLSLIS